MAAAGVRPDQLSAGAATVGILGLVLVAGTGRGVYRLCDARQNRGILTEIAAFSYTSIVLPFTMLTLT
jgi:hypothetical protein